MVSSKYEDVAEAVQYGWYKNGHDHYIKVGRLGRTDKIETNNIITELPSVNFLQVGRGPLPKI